MGYANKRNLFLRYPNEVAKKYGVGVHQFTHNRQIRTVRELIAVADRISSIESVLDCPCGSGRIASELDRFSVVCADVSSSRIKRAAANVPNATRFDVADIFDLPYSDDSFDLVLTILLLQHIEASRLPDLFREVHRVTRRWWVVTYSNRYQALSVARGLKAAPKATLSQGQFDSIAKAAGFKPIARRFVVPGIAASVTVLLEKQ